jgi:hypothetical protein
MKIRLSGRVKYDLLKSYIRHDDSRADVDSDLYYSFLYAIKHKKHKIIKYIINSKKLVDYGINYSNIANELVRYGDIKLINIFLHDINCSLINPSVLMAAMKNNNLKLVKLMLKSVKYDYYPFYAIRDYEFWSNHRCVKYFISVSKGYITKENVIHIHEIYEMAFNNKDPLLIELLLDNFNINLDFHDNISIGRICEFCNEHLVTRFLNDKTVNPLAHNNLAFRLASRNKIEVVKLLLKDSRMNLKFGYEEAIDYAIYYKKYDIVQFLINYRKFSSSKLMHTISYYADKQMAQILLSCPNFDPAADDNGLINLATWGNTQLVDALLQDNRVDPSDVVIRSIKICHLDVIEMFLRHRKKYDSRICKIDVYKTLLSAKDPRIIELIKKYEK